MPRKATSKAVEAATAIDKVFEQVDVEVLLAGALGAVAARGGIVPPFTRMLMAIGSMSTGTDAIANTLIADYKENKDMYMDVFSGLSFVGGLIPGIFGTIFFQSKKVEPA